MDQIKSKLFGGLEYVVKKIGQERSKYRRSWVQGKNDGLGREKVGADKYGNTYFQYYSYHGLPTRRIVLYKFFEHNKFHQDPHFLSWLRRNDILPPTPEALEKAYLEHDAFKERALQWDKSEMLYIRQWEQEKKHLDEEFNRSDQIESWQPETKAVAAISELDLLEQRFLTEYDKVTKFDKQHGKDFNTLAQSELKQAQYFFSYLRKQETQVRLAREKAELTKAEKILFESPAKKRAEAVLGAAKLEDPRQGKLYQKFKHEFNDIFEEQLDKK